MEEAGPSHSGKKNIPDPEDYGTDEFELYCNDYPTSSHSNN
jgi:hypothetical protein